MKSFTVRQQVFALIAGVAVLVLSLWTH